MGADLNDDRCDEKVVSLLSFSIIRHFAAELPNQPPYFCSATKYLNALNKHGILADSGVTNSFV